ncbi:MAG: flagellin, partial [Lachnospiraceae bacterium]|nr:flagellin [Lachnospiraceae bacterium]
MVIQHNISAVNAYRNLNNNTTALNKNLEKLSSGYRINRAADDAAGLAISESMRSKIAGLDQSVN